MATTTTKTQPAKSGKKGKEGGPALPLDAAPVLLLLIDLPDLLRQLRIADRMSRRPAIPPCVISSPAHTEHPAHEIHREAHPARQALILRLHTADEEEPQRF